MMTRRFLIASVLACLAAATVAPTAAAQVAVNSVTPGSATTGHDITIDGSGFTIKPTVFLKVNGSSSPKKYTLKVKSFTSTQIVATVGTVIAGNFDVNVKVKTDTGVLPNGLAIVGPSVSNMTPTSAASGDLVTIDGTFLGTKKSKVLVNGKPASVVSWSDTQITFKMPKLAAGSYPVVVDNKIGQANAGNIASNAPPPKFSKESFTMTANGAAFKSNTNVITGTHATLTHLTVVNGAVPGINGKSIQISFVYDLNGPFPKTFTQNDSGIVMSYTEVNGGSPVTYLSALPGSTYTITIQSAALTGSHPFVQFTFSGNLKGSNGQFAPISNGQAAIELVVQ